LRSLLKNDERIYQFISRLRDEGVYLSSGAESPIEIPVLKMMKPRREEFDVLSCLDVSGGFVKSIKSLLGKMRILYTGSNINKYSKIVQSLEKRGFVETERVGRNTRIVLTDPGKVISMLSDVLQD
jgi:predicted transcriptional regulator